MNVRHRHLNWKIILISLWLGFTISLAGWWMTLGLRQIDRLAQTNADTADEMARQRRMLLSEGAVWMILLVASGVTLMVFVIRDERQRRQVHDFFAGFSHDLKTAIASLRLQAESLKEDLPPTPVLDRLISDTVRLQIQLENSLFLARPARSEVIIETVQLNHLFERLVHQWPATKIVLKGNCRVLGDERALSGLFSNLIQNAIVHGRATEVVIEPQSPVAGAVEIQISNNGKPFEGNFARLAEPYFRHSTRSGSGLGLHIAKTLAVQMRGRLTFSLKEQRLISHLVLPSRGAEASVT